MSNFEKNIDLAIKSLLEIDDIDEINVTGNLDGGEGPPKSPNVFKDVEAGDPDEEPDHDSIEVFDYKKSKKSNKHFEGKSTYAKVMSQIHLNERSYTDYKKDDTQTAKQKINGFIKEMNSALFKLERLSAQNVKLKQELNVDNSQMWKSSKTKLIKISERILKLAHQYRELSS